MLDAPDANALFASDIVRSNGVDVGSTIDQLDTAVTDIYSNWDLALPSYSDQVLPFNVTLAGANEYGAMTAAKILGIEILNEGSGMSVDDAVSESQATFVARAIEPLQAVVSPFTPGPSVLPATKKPPRARRGAVSGWHRLTRLYPALSANPGSPAPAASGSRSLLSCSRLSFYSSYLLIGD